jgi:exonuclease SbcD
VARVVVAGTTPLASRLRRDADWLLDEARQVAASLSGAAVEKVSIEAQSPARPEKAADYDPVSELQDLIAGEVLGSETFRAEVRAIVTDLQQRLPPELRDSLGEGEQAIEETIARIILEGGKDVLARLEGVEPAS